MFCATVTIASVAMAVGPGVTRPAGATTTTTSFAMTTFRGSTVDPATGRLFVAGDDKVRVFNADGTLNATISNVFGAGAPFVSGPDLWVPETTAGAVARIDIATSTVAQTFTVGIPVYDSVAVLNGLVWFTTQSSGIPSYAGLATLDPTTGTALPRGGSFYQAFIRTVPGATNRLLIGEPGLSPFSVYLLDTSGPTVTTLDDVPHGVGSNLRDLAVTADGQRMVTAGGSPYLFPEFAVSTMDPTGMEYPGTNYPNGVAYTPAAGGIFVGSVDANNKLYAWADGRPVTAGLEATSGSILPGSVQVAGNRSRAYAVVQGPSGTLRLETFDLAATITSVSTNQSVQAVPTPVTVTGRTLGGVTGATIGGVAAAVTVVSPTQVQVQVPTTLPVGAHSLVLASAFGSPSVPFTVVANTGAVLTGTVRAAGSGAPGIALTLSGGGLGAPVAVTTDGTGRYSFSGVPFGTTYQLDAHDPSGTHPDQRIASLSLVPNTTTTQDLDLQVPPSPSGPSLARVALPPGGGRDVEFDPGSGRVFVSVGDEVVVFDRAGTLVARIKDQFGADGIALGGGSVWVNLRPAGRISRIDPATATVVGSWPTTTPTTGGLAYAGGNVFFTNGNDQWVTLARLDPVTGAVQKTTGNWYTPRFTNVGGAANRVLLYAQGISSNEVAQLDTSAFPPTTLLSSWTSGGSDWVASAARDRVWSSSGDERRLATLAETGVHYPVVGTSAAVAYSPAMGGIVATGRTISLAGVPTPSHLLDDTPAPRSLALDSAGDRAFLVAGNTFVVWSLRPILLSSDPTAPATPGTIAVAGSGLGSTTQVTVDGAPVAFTVEGAGRLSVDLPALGTGTHALRAVTPWGMSDPLSFEAATAPGAPTGVVARRGAGSALVGWSAPANDGGAPITQYEVTSSPGAQTCTTTGALTCRVGGLTNGTLYTFQVRARNAAGWSPLSAASAPVRPRSANRVAVFRPSAGTWYVSGGATVGWGTSGDVPVPGDYTGDGQTDFAVFRPSTGTWFVQGGPTAAWGTADDVPVPGDYDGDGTTDLAVFRPSTGTWFVQGGPTVAWGASGDVPVPGDYDGDGTTDLAVFRPSSGTWFVQGGPTVAWGASGDVPVPGDYDGDGTTDLAVFRPSSGTWFVRGGATNLWGTTGDVPVPGDYNGDGTTDLAVFRPSSGTWFVRGGATTAWGTAGDVPTP